MAREDNSQRRARRRGAFILFEGCDRAGKSSQCARLVDYLKTVKNLPVQKMNFPDRTSSIGSTIDAYLSKKSELDDRAIHLLFSANRWEAMKKMQEWLEDGVTLVVDRYAFSGVAFSSAKGLPESWCKAPDAGLLRPDMTFFLDLPIEVSEGRGGFGAERYEERKFQEKVRTRFNELGDHEGDWMKMDATQSVETLHRRICDIVDERFNEVTDRELRSDLWMT